MRLVIRDPGLGAKTVELFLATRSASATAVAPDKARLGEGREKLAGDTFFLDGPGDGITPKTTLELVDGRAVWNVQADSGASRMKVVLAVAYDGAGQVVAVASMTNVDVPTNDAVAYVMQLQAASQHEPSDDPTPGGIRVWPWRKQSASSAACLGVELSNGSQVYQRVWLVPEDDPDCDDVASECDDYYWHADQTRGSSIADANCFEATPVIATRAQCRLGSRACVDDQPPGACTALTNPQYCVANALCNPDACLADATACMTLGNTTGLACRFLTNGQGAQCADGTNIGPLKIDLMPLLPDGCSDVGFVSFDALAGGVVSSHSLAVPSPSAPTGTLSMEQFNGTRCSFEITLTGTFNTADDPPVLVGLDIRRRNGDHWLLPLVLVGDPTDCSVISQCLISLGTNEGLERCQ